jgi:hypothetical protein
MLPTIKYTRYINLIDLKLIDLKLIDLKLIDLKLIELKLIHVKLIGVKHLSLKPITSGHERHQTASNHGEKPSPSKARWEFRAGLAKRPLAQALEPHRVS